MFKIGDIVMVQGCKDLEPVRCKIVDLGPDEDGTIWYSCDPVEFQAFPREFREECLTRI